MTKRYSIDLPEEVVQKLSLQADQTVHLTVNKGTINLQPDQGQRTSQDFSIRTFLVPSLLATIAFMFAVLWQPNSHIQLTGNKSIATAVILLGELTGMFSFIRLHLQQIKKEQNPGRKQVQKRLAPTLFLSFAVIQAFATTALFAAIGYLFQEAAFDRLTATMLFFVFIAMINYLMIYATTIISPSFIMMVLIFTIVGGVLVAMVTNSSLLWWQHNFSFLGTNQANAFWTFNATLMVSGLLWATLIDYLFVPIQHKQPKSFRLWALRIFLTYDAACLFAIGAVPNNPGWLHVAHDTVANLLIIGTGLPMLLIYFLLPQATKEFRIYSAASAGVMALAAALFYGIRYLSLTAFEIIVLTSGISWLLLLMQNIHQLYQNKVESDQVQIKVAETGEA
ncbi:DUF998 domain-containing protein [Leuconostocaceae bacterium ESL0958]|nr:DUF998 domain-containing protein [Leuconostocaceae bacterium ESL0958]